jgi:hypothetical protein
MGMENIIMLGVVTKVEDSDKFIIKFKIPGYIDQDRIAYPFDTFDQPEVGDPIVLFRLSAIPSSSWLWSKQRLLDYTRLQHTDSVIEIKNEEVNIITGKSSIKMKKDGDIEIVSEGKVQIQGGGKSMLDIFDELLDNLAQTTPTTMGSATAQNFNPTIITAITKAKMDLLTLMKS